MNWNWGRVLSGAVMLAVGILSQPQHLFDLPLVALTAGELVPIVGSGALYVAGVALIALGTTDRRPR